MAWSWHLLHRKWWKRSLKLKSTQSRNGSRRRIQEEETNTRKHPLASHKSLWNLKWETNSNFSFRKEWPIETARRCPSLSLRARSRPWGATRAAKRLCNPCRHTKMRKQDKARTICSTDLTLLGLAESSRSIKCEKVWTCRKEKNRRPRRWSHHSLRLSTEPRSKRLWTVLRPTRPIDYYHPPGPALPVIGPVHLLGSSSLLRERRPRTSIIQPSQVSREALFNPSANRRE